MLVVEPKPDFERTIGETFLALEQVQHLSQDLVKRHGRPASRSEQVCGTTRCSSPTPDNHRMIDGRNVFVHARSEGKAMHDEERPLQDH
jgi:hypothetical protein